MDWTPSDFENIKIIDAGTFGTVYEATSKVDKRTYAVKRIRVGKGRRIDNYLKEVNALAIFEHPGIVTFNHAWKETIVHDLVYLYIQMELCCGTLQKWLSENRQRDLSIMKSWFKQIVFAVEYIHEMGRAHRDLKPGNILFAGPNWLKVCDLGLCNVVQVREDGELGDNHDQTDGQGTPMYKAPEQECLQYTRSNKVDIFTLGLICAELCVPMAKYQAIEAFDAFRKGDNPQIEMSQCVEEFVSWLTNVTPSERPTCSEILNGIFLRGCTLYSPDTPNEQEVHTFTRTVANDSYSLKIEDHAEIEGSFKSKFLEDFEPKRMLPNEGFGTVFEARNLLDGQMYAVKRIPTDESYVNKALVEAKASALLRHEGIVRYFTAWIEKPPPGWQHERDELLRTQLGAHNFQSMYYNWFVKDSAFLYIKMELCEGRLSDWQEILGKPELHVTKHWFEQLVSALAYLHARGIIYRDLKPTNILFGKDGLLKIADLGITTERILEQRREMQRAVPSKEIRKAYKIKSDNQPSSMYRNPRLKNTRFHVKKNKKLSQEKMRNQSTSTSREVVSSGHKVYLAPQQARIMNSNKCYTVKADMFALGLILTELCVVMTADEAVEVFDNYRAGKPNSVLDHLPDVKDLVDWLTNVDPSERPTCEELI